jgi:cytochrome b561
MRIRNSSQGYGAIAMALHWIVAVLVLAAWLLGQFGDELPRGTARQTGLFAHISIGLAIIVFTTARLLRRLIDPPPPPEKSPLGVWGERAAQAVHYLLYAALFIVPAAGIVVQFAGGHALPVFGLLELPSPWPADRTFSHNTGEIHELLANTLLILVGLHAAAALLHHYVFRDRTLLRMLPVHRT